MFLLFCYRIHMHPIQPQPSFPKTSAPAASPEQLPPHKPPTLPLDQVKLTKTRVFTVPPGVGDNANVSLL
jgi:hypothetical protein